VLFPRALAGALTSRQRPQFLDGPPEAGNQASRKLRSLGQRAHCTLIGVAGLGDSRGQFGSRTGEPLDLPARSQRPRNGLDGLDPGFRGEGQLVLIFLRRVVELPRFGRALLREHYRAPPHPH
jgi:hypothetical protein